MDDEPLQATSPVFQHDGVMYLIERLWLALFVRV
jgi:hypothetical protein